MLKHKGHKKQPAENDCLISTVGTGEGILTGIEDVLLLLPFFLNSALKKKKEEQRNRTFHFPEAKQTVHIKPKS